MKKVISLVLAIVLVASLSVAAFADIVTHYEGYCYQPVDPDEVAAAVLESAQHVKISLPAGMEQIQTAHKDAISYADLAAFTDYDNLTVFYQRTVKTAVAGEMTVKLWDCQIKRGQQVVVLALVDGVWVDLAPNSGSNTVTVTLPENVASYVVCRAY